MGPFHTYVKGVIKYLNYRVISKLRVSSFTFMVGEIHTELRGQFSLRLVGHFKLAYKYELNTTMKMLV